MNEQRLKNSMLFAALLVSFTVFFQVLSAAKIIPAQYLIGIVAVITFIGTLMISNYLSGSIELDKGEVRKSITITTFVVYFTMIGLCTYGDYSSWDKETAQMLMKHFTWLVEIVALFYFGSSIVRDLKGDRNENKNADN